MIDQPVFGGDELGGQFQFFHYNGSDKFTAIGEQNDWFVEGAYYSHNIKLQPFGKFEAQSFAASADAGNNIHRLGGGFNYYIHAQKLKWMMQFTSALPPSGSTLHESNEITLQFQVFYF